MDIKSLLTRGEMALLKIAIAILVIMLIIFVVFLFQRTAAYGNANDLMDAFRFTEAAEEFEALGQYRDSEALKYYCRLLECSRDPGPSMIPDAYEISRRFINATGYSSLCRQYPELPSVMEDIETDYEEYEKEQYLSEAAERAEASEPSYDDSDERPSTSDFGSGGVRGSVSYPSNPPSSSRRSTPKSKDTDKDDPFDADSYYQPEDFYEDHWDDFYDFEDAEDYWYDHN